MGLLLYIHLSCKVQVLAIKMVNPRIVSIRVTCFFYCVLSPLLVILYIVVDKAYREIMTSLN